MKRRDRHCLTTAAAFVLLAFAGNALAQDPDDPFASPFEPSFGQAPSPFDTAPQVDDPFADDPFGAPPATPLGAPPLDPFGALPADPFGAPAADPFGGDPFGGGGGDPFAAFGGGFGAAQGQQRGVPVPANLRPQQFRFLEVERFDGSRVVVRRAMNAEEAERFDQRIIEFYENLIARNQLPGWNPGGGATANEWAQWMLYAYQVELWQRFVERVILSGRDPDEEARRQAESARNTTRPNAANAAQQAGGFIDPTLAGGGFAGQMGQLQTPQRAIGPFGRQPDFEVTQFIRWPGDIARQQGQGGIPGQPGGQPQRNIFNENRPMEEQLFDFVPFQDTRRMQAQPQQFQQQQFGFEDEFFMFGDGGGQFGAAGGNIVFDPGQMDQQTVALYRRYTLQLREIERRQNAFVQDFIAQLNQRERRRTDYAEWRANQLDIIKDFVEDWNRRYTGEVVNVAGIRFELFLPGTEPEFIANNVNVVVTEIGLTPYDLLNPDGTIRRPVED